MASFGLTGVCPLRASDRLRCARLGQGTAPDAAVDDLQGERYLGERALQHIEPAGPAIEGTALADQGVEEDEDGCRPPHQADPIDPPEAGTRCRQEVVGLAPSVALLRLEPARKRLAVVEKNPAAKVGNAPGNSDTMGMALVAVG